MPPIYVTRDVYAAVRGYASVTLSEYLTTWSD